MLFHHKAFVARQVSGVLEVKSTQLPTRLSCVVAVFNLVALLSADFLAVTFRYKRIFSIGTKGITTYNPSNLEVTNQVRMFSSVSCYM